MTSKQLSEKIATARKQAETVEKTVSDVAERLEKMKAAYRLAVEGGETETALDARDEQIRKAERELTREQIRL
jgi:hypothetical protein